MRDEHTLGADQLHVMFGNMAREVDGPRLQSQVLDIGNLLGLASKCSKLISFRSVGAVHFHAVVRQQSSDAVRVTSGNATEAAT